MTVSEEKRSFWVRISKLDMRWVYLVLFLLMIVPIVKPFGLPVVVTPYSRGMYNYIEQNIKSGDRVFMGGDITVGFWPTEFEPGFIALVDQLFGKGAKIYFFSIGPDEPIVISQAFNSGLIVPAKYGTDYVFLGYYPGGEVALAAFAKDVRSIVKTDYYGTSIDQIPMMKDINNIKDFKFVIGLATSGNEWYVRQFQSPYGVPLGELTLSGGIPNVIPFYLTKQVVGFVAGLKAGAEYELLTGRSGVGLRSTDAISVGNLYFGFIMVLANIVFFMTRRRN